MELPTWLAHQRRPLVTNSRMRNTGTGTEIESEINLSCSWLAQTSSAIIIIKKSTQRGPTGIRYAAAATAATVVTTGDYSLLAARLRLAVAASASALTKWRTGMLCV